jgi:hypothetical protein
MMKKITLLFALLFVSFGYSQTLPINFEESDDSNIFASVSDGGTFSIIADAVTSGEFVGEFSGKVGGASYDHINVPLTTSLDIAATNTISFRVKQTTTEGTTSHVFKLQPNGGTGSNQEVAFTTEYDVWKDITLTYSGTGTYNELIIFFDFNSATVSGTYLIDDIVASSGQTAAAIDLPFDFETSPVTSDWVGFAGAGITVEAVASPQTTGNSSTNLAKIIRNGGEGYAGVASVFDTALDFSTKSTITARIWTSAPIGTKIMFKTEEAGSAGNNSGEKDVFTTKTGEWENLVFDFDGVENASQTRIVIIPDNGNVGDGSAASTFYFDDIIQAVSANSPPSENSVTVATSQAWKGFMNVFNLDDSYAFGFEYGAADLRATATTTSMTLEPNIAIWTAEATNEAWFDQSASSQTANKYIEASSFIEDNTLAGSDLTFSGNVSVADLGEGYTVVAFVKALDPNNGYATVVNNNADISSTGDFTTSATAAELVEGYIIQYGFTVTGPLGDPDDTTLGSVVIGSESLSVEDTNIINVSVYPNPSSSNWNFRTGNTVITSIEVFNLLGKRVVSQNNNSTNITVSTQELTSGIYIANIITEQGIKSVKLIKN